MTFRRTATLAVLMTMGLASLASAQGHDNRPGGPGHGPGKGQPQRVEQRAPQAAPQRPSQGRDHRVDDRRDVRRNDYRGSPGPQARSGRGAGPSHNFYKGDRLAPQWRSRQYVVDDWRGHRLSAPPRGYQWVQTGTDYVLVAIATGLIAQILLSQ